MRLDRDRLVFTCEYCATVVFPQESDDGIRVLGEPTPFECPACHRLLVWASVDRTMVSICENCRGLLIAQPIFYDTIRYLRARAVQPSLAPRPADLTELKRHIRCPKCRRPMDVHPYGGPGNVIVDNCPRCGLLWLDTGELTRIVRTRELKDGR
jgi:Zn-finger nucleic acid-binding protein